MVSPSGPAAGGDGAGGSDRRRLRQVRRLRAGLRVRPGSRLPPRLRGRCRTYDRSGCRREQRVLPAAGAAHSCICSPCIPPPAGSTRWTRACDRAARAGCSRRASPGSSSTSEPMPGPGSTRRCCAHARWPDRRRCASASRRCASSCFVQPCVGTRCARRCARCASACAQSWSRTSDGEFDLKQDHGGIADIEFLAQYWTLKWSERFAELVMFPDVIRQLESLASVDLVPQATVDVLTGAYRAYRQRIHHLSLESGGSLVPCHRVRSRARGGERDLAGDDGRLRRHLRAAYNPGPESRGCAMTELLVPISPGELIDKITILEIKSQRMSDAVKLANVRTELALLMDTWQASPWSAADIAAEWADLRAVNEKLWVDRGRDPRQGTRRALRPGVHRAGPRGLRDQRRARRDQEAYQHAARLDARRGKELRRLPAQGLSRVKAGCG